NPICTSLTCGPCQSDYAPSPGPGACPTAALPACQAAGSAMAGACTQCSATNATVCQGNAGTPVCIVASAVCGCTVDTDCAQGNYCDTAQVSTGYCEPGCTVT